MVSLLKVTTARGEEREVEWGGGGGVWRVFFAACIMQSLAGSLFVSDTLGWKCAVT